METINTTNISSEEKVKNLEIVSDDKLVIDFINKAFQEKINISEFAKIFKELREKYKETSFIGNRKNNSGIIEIGGDPGKSGIERKTNNLDGVLDYHFETDDDVNKKEIISPRQAAKKYFDIDIEKGLASMDKAKRRNLAKETSIVRYLEGDGPNKRILDFFDNGTGIRQLDFHKTILSLNESNKIGKLHLMGQYGQGGSSTFNYSDFTLIASRHHKSNTLSFTVVWYKQPEIDEKKGSYVYLTHNRHPLAVKFENIKDLPYKKGVFIRHFGYDLSKYRSGRGQGSLYLLLQKSLFNPPLPFYFMNKVDSYGNRTIKGSRAAFLGGLDPEDKDSKLEIIYSDSISEKKISGGKLGSIKIEYWVVKNVRSKFNKETGKRDNPVNPLLNHTQKYKPIIFTHNGQTQHEGSNSLIKHQMGFEYLKDTLVIHVECDSLSIDAKRNFFASNREAAKEGTSEYSAIIDSLVDHLKSDSKLEELNLKAAEEIASDDETLTKSDLQKDISKFIEATGGTFAGVMGQSPSGKGTVSVPGTGNSGGGGSGSGGSGGSGNSGGNRKSTDIKINEPPTFIKILWDQETIKFYNTQERYLRVITDANNSYQDKINLTLDENFSLVSKTKLSKGRIRFCVRCVTDKIGKTGQIKVNLNCDVSNINFDDQKNYLTRDIPKDNKPAKPMMPDISIKEVKGIQDELWEQLFEKYSDDPDKSKENEVAFHYKKITIKKRRK